MAHTGTYGVIFLITLLLVIVITNVPLRGMWSVVVIITIILLSIIFGLAGWWEKIIHALQLLDIRINAAGYFFVSLILFAIWLITFVFFDRQMYMIFTPGQLKVREQIGGGAGSSSSPASSSPASSSPAAASSSSPSSSSSSSSSSSRSSSSSAWRRS